VEVIFSLENISGDEEILFGSDDGFVYQMEKGTSFDGAEIESYLFIHNYFSKSVRWLKKYRTATLQVRSSGYSEMDFSYEIGFDTTEKADAATISSILDFSSASWDNGVWDTGSWDGVSRISPVTHKINGSGEGIAFVFRRSSEILTQVTISGIHIQYDLRRQIRN
jgi:hypothetical protein